MSPETSAKKLKSKTVLSAGESNDKMSTFPGNCAKCILQTKAKGNNNLRRKSSLLGNRLTQLIKLYIP